MSDSAETVGEIFGGPSAYNRLRSKLIWFFSQRGQSWRAEDLADETLKRAVAGIAEGKTVPSVGAFANGIAKNVLSEAVRKREHEALTSDPTGPETENIVNRIFRKEIFRQCTAEERMILEQYILGDKAKLARKLGISPNALRMRVFHIRERLRKLYVP